ncbi:MAG: TIGR00730 family Rossman fold protein [bacterium]
MEKNSNNQITNSSLITNPPLTRDQVIKDYTERLDRIHAEFLKGLELIADNPKSVTFFGSARFKPDTKWYEKTRQLAAAVSKETGYTIVSGGGPGVMEAANRGAKDVNGKTIGYTIQLPHEQSNNPYLNDFRSFNYFFVRKMMLNYSAEAYIVCPGGFGTMDEFFGILTLVQTKKIPSVPIILYGKAYWKPMIKFFRKYFLKKYKTISEEDFNDFIVTDDTEKIIDIIKKAQLRAE